MQTTQNAVENLTHALIDGSAPAADAARRCLAAGLPAEAVTPALLEAERTLALSVVDGRASAASSAMADRLRVALDVLAPLWADTSAAAGAPTGTIALASLPGDAHDVGRHLWRALLMSRGFDVHDLGLRAPVIVAQHVAKLQPNAVGLYVLDARGRAAVQSLVAHLLRSNLQVPVLIGGPGVDEEFARWVSVPEGGVHYWAGVYYCEDVSQAVEVLRQIVLYEPPPQTHTHDHDPSTQAEGCSSCCGCALADSCDLPEAAGA